MVSHLAAAGSPIAADEDHAGALDALARCLTTAAEQVAAGETDTLTSVLDVDATGAAGEVVIAAQQLLNAMHRSHALETAVHELFEALSHHRRIEYLSYEALYRVVQHTHASAGAIVLVADRKPDVVATFDLELDAAALVACVEASEHCSESVTLTTAGSAEVVVAPFAGDGWGFGAVVLVGVELEPELRRLLALLGRALGFAVSNALAHSETERQASVDPLTGCANRRAGMRAVQEALRIARLRGSPLAVLMVDLDHFKAINDRHGHIAGDAVLTAAGRAIAECFRDCDVVMRYGGEEFVVAVTGAASDRLADLAERVRRRVEAIAVGVASGDSVPVTASIGVAEFGADETLEALISRADEALYLAKHAGRNRTVRAADPG